MYDGTESAAGSLVITLPMDEKIARLSISRDSWDPVL
jgi:hypothetical protein